MQCVQQNEKVDELMNSMSLLKPMFYSRLDWLIKSWTVLFVRFPGFVGLHRHTLLFLYQSDQWAG